jgi:hypothetical protein
MPPEWPVTPVVSSVQLLMPRRPIVAVPSMAALEAERGVARPCELDHGRTRDRERQARVFLVASEHDRDAPVLECARRMQRLERLHHHDGAALHVRSAGSERARALAAEWLAGEHRVHVAEQQQPLASRAAGLRHQVPRTLHLRRHLDPARLEADRPELLGESVARRAHARDVFRRAFDVHDALQQRFRRRLAGRRVLGDRTLSPVERRLRGGSEAEGQRKK